MSSSTADHGINGNLNVSNTLNSSGLSVKSGTVDFTGASFVNSCIPISSISGSVGGGSTNASTITVSSDASTISNGFLTYCGVTNNNVVLRTFSALRFNSTTGTLSSINFSGSATTQATTDNSTQIATTEFVQNNILGLSSIYASIASLSSYLTITASSAFAPLASPIFTGNPTAPTPSTSDNSTTIATTAYVKSNINNLLVNGVYYPYGASPYLDATVANAYNTYAKAYTISGPILYAYYPIGFTNTNVYIKLPLPSSTYNGAVITFRHTYGTGGSAFVYWCTSATTSTTVGTSFMNTGQSAAIVTGYWQVGSTMSTYWTFICLPNNTAYYWSLLTFV